MDDLERRLRELDFIKPGESVESIKDYSKLYSWNGGWDEYHGRGGQVYWWLVDVNFSGGKKRTYVMKCPHDTFGDGIRYFVESRVDLSRKFRENGIGVPRIEKYDNGTMVHEYVIGLMFDEAVRKNPGKKELYMSKRVEITSRIKSLGYSLRDEDHDGNYIVTSDDDVILIDLDAAPIV